jgi:hypothetical protein
MVRSIGSVHAKTASWNQRRRMAVRCIPARRSAVVVSEARIGCDEVRLVASGNVFAPHPEVPAATRTVTPVRFARRASGAF